VEGLLAGRLAQLLHAHPSGAWPKSRQAPGAQLPSPDASAPSAPQQRDTNHQKAFAEAAAAEDLRCQLESMHHKLRSMNNQREQLQHDLGQTQKQLRQVRPRWPAPALPATLLHCQAAAAPRGTRRRAPPRTRPAPPARRRSRLPFRPSSGTAQLQDSEAMVDDLKRAKLALAQAQMGLEEAQQGLKEQRKAGEQATQRAAKADAECLRLREANRRLIALLEGNSEPLWVAQPLLPPPPCCWPAPALPAPTRRCR
jgi:hypothetical protein